MSLPQKGNVPVSLRLERSVFDKLNQFCVDSCQPKTVAMERSLDMYFTDYNEKRAQFESMNK